MKRKTKTALKSDRAKEFAKVFEILAYKHGAWQVWQDFIDLCACSISNVLEMRESVRQSRENAYLSITKNYSQKEFEQFVDLFSITIHALEENPAQDFLGELYMKLDFGNSWTGQFFTPYHIAELMARMSIGDKTKKDLEEKGFITVNDPTCGAGCMLLAFVQAYRAELKENYQQSVLFVGQDIDPVVAKMCYIQLSLMGCAGYVAIGNTLTEPVLGDSITPAYDAENLWFTPMYFSDLWTARRLIHSTFLENGGIRNENGK